MTIRCHNRPATFSQTASTHQSTNQLKSLIFGMLILAMFSEGHKLICCHIKFIVTCQCSLLMTDIHVISLSSGLPFSFTNSALSVCIHLSIVAAYESQIMPTALLHSLSQVRFCSQNANFQYCQAADHGTSIYLPWY